MAATNVRQEAGFEAGRQAYEASDLCEGHPAAAGGRSQRTQNGEVQLLLAKVTWNYKTRRAIKSAEKAVAIDPQNSIYHEWLGRAYGEKADHAGWFSAMSLAKKTRKEFETAVQLDGRNFSARQALIEFDCSAPASWVAAKRSVAADPAIGGDGRREGITRWNCRRTRKIPLRDEEFAKALESHPKSAELIYDIGDHAVKRGQPQLLLEVADVGERVARDPRGKFYRAWRWS